MKRFYFLFWSCNFFLSFATFHDNNFLNLASQNLSVKIERCNKKYRNLLHLPVKLQILNCSVLKLLEVFSFVFLCWLQGDGAKYFLHEVLFILIIKDSDWSDPSHDIGNWLLIGWSKAQFFHFSSLINWHLTQTFGIIRVRILISIQIEQDAAAAAWWSSLSRNMFSVFIFHLPIIILWSSSLFNEASANTATTKETVISHLDELVASKCQ